MLRQIAFIVSGRPLSSKPSALPLSACTLSKTCSCHRLMAVRFAIFTSRRAFFSDAFFGAVGCSLYFCCR